MARWEPDARGRLVRAAVQLFAEQGYGSTTTAQIAQRAGLSKITFFRQFSEKREVLFAGQEQLVELATSGVASAPADAGPLRAAAAGVEAMASAFGPEQRDYGLQLQSIVTTNVELIERAAYKRATIAAALAEALRRRGVGEPEASLAAELGIRAFYLAYERWVEPDNAAAFLDLVRVVLKELRAGAATLAAEDPASPTAPA